MSSGITRGLFLLPRTWLKAIVSGPRPAIRDLDGEQRSGPGVPGSLVPVKGDARERPPREDPCSLCAQTKRRGIRTEAPAGSVQGRPGLAEIGVTGPVCQSHRPSGALPGHSGIATVRSVTYSEHPALSGQRCGDVDNPPPGLTHITTARRRRAHHWVIEPWTTSTAPE